MAWGRKAADASWPLALAHGICCYSPFISFIICSGCSRSQQRCSQRVSRSLQYMQLVFHSLADEDSVLGVDDDGANAVEGLDQF